MHEIMENDYMFSGRGKVPWHKLGAVVGGALNSEEAIKAAKLGWIVKQNPVFFSKNNLLKSIPHYFANVRSDTNEVLGIVGERYSVIQNKALFDFADALISTKTAECTYETAGSLFNGRRVFLLVNMPKRQVVGDEYQPYLCLSNTHDGTSALQVFLTGVRVVCNNTLQMALKTTKRKIAIRHLSGIGDRTIVALRTLGMASKYFTNLEAFALRLTGKTVDIDEVLKLLFPISEKMPKYWLDYYTGVNETIKGILKDTDNLQNINNTAWGVYNAIADYRSNAKPRLETKTYEDTKMERFLDGDEVMSRAQKIIMKLAA
jgi:phage/plasmid-like protein (TIGR03299 family)